MFLFIWFNFQLYRVVDCAMDSDVRLISLDSANPIFIEITKSGIDSVNPFYLERSLKEIL